MSETVKTIEIESRLVFAGPERERGGRSPVKDSVSGRYSVSVSSGCHTNYQTGWLKTRNFSQF